MPATRFARSCREWTRPLASVSVRLMVIILLAVVPVGMLGALMAYHTYVATVDASAKRAAVMTQTLRAQLDQRISDARHMLHELAEQPQLQDSRTCGPLLRQALRLQTVSLGNIVLLGADRQPICASDVTTPPREADEPEIRPLLDRPANSPPMLRLSVPATFAGQSASLSADLSLGWTHADLVDAELWRAPPGGGEIGAWLLPAAGAPMPLCVDCGWNAANHERGAIDRAKEGRYLARAAVAGLDLLVVAQPTRAEDRALGIFLFRVIGIAVLLALGLAIVMVGARALIVVPMRGLTRSVASWRDAGAYLPAHSVMMPIELRQLSRAFADATKVVAAHEERLRRAEIKQELLIKEIHHRVKNNLQIIASLLNLQANRIRQPEARAEFASARDRVRALATLHRHLYSEGELHTLNMKSFLEELCGQLFQAIGETEGRRIRLEIDAPEIVMSTDQAVPLALVVTEAVSNAIKYAFPGGRSGFVSVRLSEDVPGIATLVIRDNGIGIPAGRAETETGIRDGLGIQLIRGFARQLGARLEVVEGAADQDGRSGGTCYTLTLPLQPEPETSDPAPASMQPASAGAGPDDTTHEPTTRR